MRRYETWRADRFRFAVSGRGAQNFITAAARRGVRLDHLRCTADGYTGMAPGGALGRLQALARRGGWKFEVLRRAGPGSTLERLLARPGVPVGIATFVVLVHLLSGYVWCIDFGGLDPDRQTMLREALARNDVMEGTRLSEERLAQVQQALDLQADDFGWLSLNFTGGCLFAEATERQIQGVEEVGTVTALYARTGGEVVTVDVQSGFAAVSPGQYVAAGQLLANAQKLDRNNRPVVQTAQGRIIARVSRRYTAVCPLEREETILTGETDETTTLYLLGQSRDLTSAAAPGPDDIAVTDWQPLQLGRVALPGCLRRVTIRRRASETVRLSEQAARAVARRSCRRQLAEEFPDAVIEEESVSETVDETGASCTIQYIFCADIAEKGPLR